MRLDSSVRDTQTGGVCLKRITTMGPRAKENNEIVQNRKRLIGLTVGHKGDAATATMDSLISVINLDLE